MEEEMRKNWFNKKICFQFSRRFSVLFQRWSFCRFRCSRGRYWSLNRRGGGGISLYQDAAEELSAFFFPCFREWAGWGWMEAFRNLIKTFVSTFLFADKNVFQFPHAMQNVSSAEEFSFHLYWSLAIYPRFCNRITINFGFGVLCFCAMQRRLDGVGGERKS